jgi:hypothetical protein
MLIVVCVLTGYCSESSKMALTHDVFGCFVYLGMMPWVFLSINVAQPAKISQD